MLKITPENVHEFGVGTKVEINFGAYYPLIKGVVVGSEIMPATKWFPHQAQLHVEYECIEDGETVRTTVREFSDKGVGVRLVEIATPHHMRNHKSKWCEN